MLSAKITLFVVGVVIVASILGYVVGYETTKKTAAYETTTKMSPQNHYVLAFVQNPSKCPDFGFVTPWRVTLSDGESITSPPNANLSECCTSDGTVSTINFSVPNGYYSYTVTPIDLLPANGLVNVSGQNAAVYLSPEFATCGSISTASTYT